MIRDLELTPSGIHGAPIFCHTLITSSTGHHSTARDHSKHTAFAIRTGATDERRANGSKYGERVPDMHTTALFGC
eukprot:scaffold55987_cov72-Phaeocystis_antarctica.AAC.8